MSSLASAHHLLVLRSRSLCSSPACGSSTKDPRGQPRACPFLLASYRVAPGSRPWSRRGLPSSATLRQDSGAAVVACSDASWHQWRDVHHQCDTILPHSSNVVPCYRPQTLPMASSLMLGGISSCPPAVRIKAGVLCLWALAFDSPQQYAPSPFRQLHAFLLQK